MGDVAQKLELASLTNMPMSLTVTALFKKFDSNSVLCVKLVYIITSQV